MALVLSPSVSQTIAVNTPICFQASGTVIIPQEDERYLDLPASGANWTFTDVNGIYTRTGGTNGLPQAGAISDSQVLAIQPFYIVGTNWTFTTPTSPLKQYNTFVGVFDDNDLFYGWCMFKYCGDNPSCDGNTGGNWNASVIWAGVTVATFTAGINFKDQFRVQSDGVYLNIKHEAGLIYQPLTSYRQILPETEKFRFHLQSLYNGNELWFVRTFKGTFQGSVPVTWSVPDGGVLTGEGDSRCFTVATPGAYSICIDSDYDEPLCVGITADELYFEPSELECSDCVFAGDIVTFNSNGGLLGTLEATAGTVIDSLTWQAPGQPGGVSFTYTLGEDELLCSLTVVERLKILNVEGDTLLGLGPGETFQIQTNYGSSVRWENLDCPNVVTETGLIVIPSRVGDECFGALDCYIRGVLIGAYPGGEVCENLIEGGDNAVTITLRIIIVPVFPTPEFGGPKPLKWKPETPDFRTIINTFEGGCDETYLRNRVPIYRWKVNYGGLAYDGENPCLPIECCDDTTGFIGGFNPRFQTAKRLDDFWNLVAGEAGYFTLKDYRTGEIWKNVRFEGTIERDHINWIHSHTRSFTLVWRPCCASEPKGGICRHNTTKYDTYDPSVPTDLNPVATSPYRIFVTWIASTDNVGIAGYELEINGVPITLNSTPWYAHEGLSPDSENFYRVRAFDFSGNYSAWTSIESATTDDIDLIDPAIPANLTATTQSDTEILVEWDASTDNVAVTGYKLLINGVVTDVGNVLSYLNEDLESNTEYEYFVRAYDAIGNQSNWSSSTTATTDPAYVVDNGEEVIDSGIRVVDSN